MRKTIHSIWAYRYFILSSIQTNFKSRFARSKLGGLWMILHPLAQVLIYALILSNILKAKLPGIESQYAYAIYLMAGMVGWTLFSEIVGASIDVFISNANLLKKMAFPKLTLPLIVIGNGMVNFLLLLLAMFVVFAFLGHVALHAIIWLPLLILVTLALAVGIGLTLGVINVFIRDVGQVMSIVLQFWFWLTPVVYTLSIVPEEYHHLFFINPMAGVIEGYHNILVYDKAPDFGLLIYPSIVGIVTLILALYLFKRANEDMTDVL
ncbi:MAG: ABC transporter permease [Campylobacterota bacterium]|nr:ABC transporter permease [Campylobacterota bacterium]